MTLEEKFRERLQGHLSDEKTEVDVRIAVNIAEEFAIKFAEWINSNAGYAGNGFYVVIGHNGCHTIRKILEIYKKEKEL